MHRHRLGTGERERDRRGAVLVYHSIGSVPRDAPGFNGFIPAARFAAQMAYLAEHRRRPHRREIVLHLLGEA